MPKQFPAEEKDYTPEDKKKLQAFLKKADDKISSDGRIIWFDESFKIIARSNRNDSARKQARENLQKQKNDMIGKIVVKVTFRVWKTWIDIFDKDRGAIEIQAIRYRVQEHPNGKENQYSFAHIDDRRSYIRMFYHPEEVHLFKISHLKSMAKAVYKAKYSTRLVTTYNAKDFNFIKKK